MRIGAFLGVLLLCTASHAHHGTPQFDKSKILHVRGVITAYHWLNPHVFIFLQPADERDEIRIEAAGPSGLVTLGVSAESLRPGEQVVAIVHPSIHRDSSALASEFIKQDGTIVPMFARSPRATAVLDAPTGVAEDIFGRWVPDRGDFFRIFAFGRSSWPLTAIAEAALAGYTTADNPQAHCVPLNAPTVMMNPSVHTISKENDHIRISTDWMGAERIVYLDGRDHPADSKRFPQGHSVGRWDGSTLVIDTRNFPPGPSGNTSGIPSSREKHLIERIHLSDDGAYLHIQFILEDPAYFTEPVKKRHRWAYRPDLKPSGVPCDLESAADFLVRVE